MKNLTVRRMGEIIAIVGVVLSLMFVGYEIQQSNIAARSAAFQEIGVATSHNWLVLAQNGELSEIMLQANSIDGYEKLSFKDKFRVNAYLISFMRVAEVVYLQIDQGLLEESAFDTLGGGDVSFETNVMKAAWPRLKGAVTPEFAEFMESRYGYLAE